MSSPTGRFVENLRRLRKEMRLSAAQLVAKVNAEGVTLSRNMLTNIENARRDHITVDEAYALAAALGTSVDYLVNYSGPRCVACLDEPPTGFSCNECGAGGEPR